MTAEGKIAFRWGVSSFFGWGIYGLNLMLNWPGLALSLMPFGQIVAVNDEQRRRLTPHFEAAKALQAELADHANRMITLRMPVFISYGNNLIRYFGAHGEDVFGSPSVGFAFLEDSACDPAHVEGVNALAAMVAGSRWNAELMAEAGVTNVLTVLQGVDCELFQPRPRAAAAADRFVVFSGGQCCFRKGQDLVLAAFRGFAQRHPDALLATAWHSPWPKSAETFESSSLMPPPPLLNDGELDVTSWAAGAGVLAHQFVDLGKVPNPRLASVLTGVDVALFPNRGEGGTNLMAMECLASGIPTILSNNTGHLDLIGRTGTYALTRQMPVSRPVKLLKATAGWGESDVEEIVAQLETIYTQREAARARAAQAAAAMQDLSWPRQIARLHAALSPLF